MQEGTVSEYTRRALFFIKQFRAAKLTDIHNTKEVGNLLVDYWQETINTNKYSKSTIRKQKAFLMFWANKNNLSRVIDILQTRNVVPPKKPPKKKTSSQKQKYLGGKLYTSFKAALSVSKSQYKDMVATWLTAGELTGLRPQEWITTQIAETKVKSGTKKVLRVCNAKQSYGRSFGRFRYIVLENLNTYEENIINQMIAHVQGLRQKFPTKDGETDKNGDPAIASEQAIKEWNEIYNKCRNYITRLNDTIPKSIRKGKSITLYSARHQFAADLKANNFDFYHIAALMGHASIQTASEHYGRKIKGKEQGNTFRVRATDDCIQIVKNITNKGHEIKLEKRLNQNKEMKNEKQN